MWKEVEEGEITVAETWKAEREDFRPRKESTKLDTHIFYYIIRLMASSLLSRKNRIRLTFYELKSFCFSFVGSQTIVVGVKMYHKIDPYTEPTNHEGLLCL